MTILAYAYAIAAVVPIAVAALTYSQWRATVCWETAARIGARHLAFAEMTPAERGAANDGSRA